MDSPPPITAAPSTETRTGESLHTTAPTSPDVPRLQSPLSVGFPHGLPLSLGKKEEKKKKGPQVPQHRVIQGQQNKELSRCQHPHSRGSICRSNKKVSQSSTASSPEPAAQKQPQAGEQLTRSPAELPLRRRRSSSSRHI